MHRPSVCEKGKQPERALELNEANQWQDVVPNVITYCALISACEKGKQPERTLELNEAMQRLSACEKGKQPDRALELFEAMDAPRLECAC